MSLLAPSVLSVLMRGISLATKHFTKTVPVLAASILVSIDRAVDQRAGFLFPIYGRAIERGAMAWALGPRPKGPHRLKEGAITQGATILAL